MVYRKHLFTSKEDPFDQSMSKQERCALKKFLLIKIAKEKIIKGASAPFYLPMFRAIRHDKIKP